MEFMFTVETDINLSQERVFKAIASEEEISCYFTKHSSGPLQEGATVRWSWPHCPENEVVVRQVVPDRTIVISWESHPGSGAKTEAIFEFEALGPEKTKLKITEQGWEKTASGLEHSYQNCAGWQHMAMCLKAYLEHNIDLRE